MNYVKVSALVLLLALVAGYCAMSAHDRARRAAQVQVAEEGAAQALTDARQAAADLRTPPGWTKDTRRVTVAFPIENREEDIAYWTNPEGMAFVSIPAGRCLMGQKGTPDTVPEHWVRLTRPFLMGANEITRAQYEAVTGKPVPFRQGPQRANEPACGVAWDDAVEFCRILSEREGIAYRLPAEAEWEYACRAGTTTRFYMGVRDPKELCCICYKPDAVAAKEHHSPRYHPEPVGTTPANAFGLFNMAGNAWEWCQDWYAPDYYRRSPTDDPPGPASGTSHVRRGGSYVTGRLGCASDYRVSPDAPKGAGFRLVLPHDAMSEALP